VSHLQAFAIGLATSMIVCFIVGGLLVITIGSPSADDDPAHPAAGLTDSGTVVTATTVEERSPSKNGVPPVDEFTVDVVAAVNPAVVTVISVVGQSGDVVDTTDSMTASGVILDKHGHIVTTSQIIGDNSVLYVVFANGDAVEASLVGINKQTELAVIHVDGKLPGIATFGDSSELKPGQPVLAIGSPLGSFPNSVTQGVVSALGRSVSNPENTATLTGLIQHDAAVTLGGAGGPLVDADGEVIGVNTLTATQTDNGQPTQGLFFAIPSNTVKKIVKLLIAAG
jgi:S1-C subfamily serine protease